MIISICIVLNTMISSVYERKREIGIYTSVGLAPVHVSFLFVAEALAFAVLSVVMGYIVAQATAWMFSKTSFWAGITVNYSSLAGVGAMVLVMMVVLISVIYPSRVAAQIAIPDVNRSWKMPDPKESQIEITLPFLIQPGERPSIGGYLYSHFDNHQDVSHGIFSTGGLRMEKFRKTGEEGDVLRLCAKVWLAPFDFGIMQRVEIRFPPAENQSGFFEILVRIFRETGETNTWGRINKIFVNELRKQLLIWRSFDPGTMTRYEGIYRTRISNTHC
jgi:hypothetical protein